MLGLEVCVTTPGLFDAGNQSQGFLHDKQAFDQLSDNLSPGILLDLVLFDSSDQVRSQERWVTGRRDEPLSDTEAFGIQLTTCISEDLST